MSRNYTNQDVMKEKTLALGMGEAIKWSAISLATSTGGVMYMMHSRPWFMKSTNVSSRVAIPTMITMFAFALSFELTQISAQRNPDKWGLVKHVDAGQDKKQAVRVMQAPFHHIVMNRIYENPFMCIAMFGTPLAVAILHQQLQLKHITFSQRIMHTRVYAQMGILTIGLSTLAFRDYMDRRGKFPEGEEIPLNKPEPEASSAATQQGSIKH